MSEFNRVANATFSPTACALCGTHEGPFIDTHVEWPAYGHVWICLGSEKRSGCVAQMFRLDPEYQNEQIVALEQRIMALEAQLNDARLNQNIRVGDLPFVTTGVTSTTGPQLAWTFNQPETPKRGRGRPPGSKNKPKPPPEDGS